MGCLCLFKLSSHVIYLGQIFTEDRALLEVKVLKRIQSWFFFGPYVWLQLAQEVVDHATQLVTSIRHFLFFWTNIELAQLLSSLLMTLRFNLMYLFCFLDFVSWYNSLYAPLPKLHSNQIQTNKNKWRMIKIANYCCSLRYVLTNKTQNYEDCTNWLRLFESKIKTNNK